MIEAAVFWTCVGLLGYVYFGYPALARFAARCFGRPVRAGSIAPVVTVVVAAYNEEAGIQAKLDNILGLDYPPELLNVIVASDGSTDRTDEIVRQNSSNRVQLLRVEGRRGKTACQNAAVQAASGDIVVFTDATTRIEAHTIQAMVGNFADANVGCVAGSLVYEAKSASLTGQGGTAYWNYELGLRRAESSLGSLVGVSGCLYAVRRSAYTPIQPELISDFVIAMRIREAGLRTVLEPAAVCFEDTLEHSRSELAMRVRVGIRSINALVHERRMLNPFHCGVFAWQLWSHKALRYASPFFWLAALITNLGLLGDGWIYQVMLAGQLAILLLGTLGFFQSTQSQGGGLLRKPYYFVLTNLASLLATVKFLRGERMIVWKPVR
jgi:cellulose synthase/poly-beta-1,6-N-acetylglucosamine synthase-like glycosyltransferase